MGAGQLHSQGRQAHVQSVFDLVTTRYRTQRILAFDWAGKCSLMRSEVDVRIEGDLHSAGSAEPFTYDENGVLSMRHDNALFNHLTLVLERPHRHPEFEPELAQLGERQVLVLRIRLLGKARATFVRGD